MVYFTWTCDAYDTCSITEEVGGKNPGNDGKQKLPAAFVLSMSTNLSAQMDGF